MPAEEAPSGPERPTFEAFFCVTADALDPECVTALLQVQPTDTTPKPTSEGSPPGHWDLQSPLPSVRPLDEHVSGLLELLAGRSKGWGQLLARTSAFAEMACNHFAAPPGDGLYRTVLGATTVRRLAEHHFLLHIEYFPPFHWSRDESTYGPGSDEPDPDEPAVGCESATVGLAIQFPGPVACPRVRRRSWRAWG